MTAATPGQAMAAPEDKTPPEYQMLGWAATLLACSAPGAALPSEHWREGVRNWQDAYAALVATPAAQEPHAAAKLAACGCPATDGKVYHQRGTCTDPVVAKLDWYADSGRIAAAPEAQPAPELADAMRETKAVLGLLDEFTRDVITYSPVLRIAKTAGTVRKNAGLPPVEGK